MRKKNHRDQETEEENKARLQQQAIRQEAIRQDETER